MRWVYTHTTTGLQGGTDSWTRTGSNCGGYLPWGWVCRPFYRKTASKWGTWAACQSTQVTSRGKILTVGQVLFTRHLCPHVPILKCIGGRVGFTLDSGRESNSCDVFATTYGQAFVMADGWWLMARMMRFLWLLFIQFIGNAYPGQFVHNSPC